MATPNLLDRLEARLRTFHEVCTNHRHRVDVERAWLEGYVRALFDANVIRDEPFRGYMTRIALIEEGYKEDP